MDQSLRQLILSIMYEGVHGDIGTITGWAKMALAISEKDLPSNLKDYQKDYAKYLSFRNFSGVREKINTENVQDIIFSLRDEGILEELSQYHEYRLKDRTQWSFHKKNSEIFFACNDLQLGPLQLIRSKIQNFFDQYHISREELDELIIVATEAAENAVKYSNEFIIIIKHSLINNIYELRLFNSYSEVSLNDEISSGKFSNDVSLMRGVLVMTKLLDELDIKRDMENHRVIFFGKKTLKSLTA